MKEKLSIGQTVYMSGGHYHKSDQPLKHGKITKLGHKYFTVNDGYNDRKFNYEDSYENVDSNYRMKAWLSEDDYNYMVEMNMKRQKIRREFSGYGQPKLSDEQIIAIYDIIFTEKL